MGQAKIIHKEENRISRKMNESVIIRTTEEPNKLIRELYIVPVLRDRKELHE
jgi:hypothetical protein